ncbi:MAG: ferritin-like domain-containing protein [Candidatus Bathyarchaeota archaeon]
MSSKKLLEYLNTAIARELQVSIQYMWQHIQVNGIMGAVVADTFKDIAITEMKHAEALAERLAYLNGIPTTKPDPIFVRSSLKDMIVQDQKDEEGAIELYRRGIQMAKDEFDYGTQHLLVKILTEEEEHIDIFGKLLIGMTSPFTQPEIE